MNITLRSFLSALFGVGLLIATVVLAIVNDIAASSTVVAFSLLTVYGLVEMAILSYSRLPSVRLTAAPAAAQVVAFEPEWKLVREPRLNFSVAHSRQRPAPCDARAALAA